MYAVIHSFIERFAGLYAGRVVDWRAEWRMDGGGEATSLFVVELVVDSEYFKIWLNKEKP